MAEVLILFVSFVVLVFGVGPVMIPTRLGSPLLRVTVGVAASLTGLYLLGFGIYLLHLTGHGHWLLLIAALVFVGHHRRRLGQLWSDPVVRRVALVWLGMVAWLMGCQFTVYSYSGATWQGDWYEHYDRSRFFLEHWDVHHRFLDIYSLSARPPLVNILTAGFLSLAGTKFHVFQACCVLLASLVVWPVCLLQCRFVRPGAVVRFGWVALVLMALPSYVQNAVFTWTKLPTVFLS